MKKMIPLVALATLLPLAASAGVFKADKPSDEKLKVRAADAIGVDPDEISLDEVTQDGMTTRYKAKLADGTTYRCSVEGATGLMKFGSFGAADDSAALCTKRPGSGKGPEVAKNPLQQAAEAREQKRRK